MPPFARQDRDRARRGSLRTDRRVCRLCARGHRRGANAVSRARHAPVLVDGSVPAPPGVEGFRRCLLHAVQALFDRGHAAACVLSADTPTLPTAALVTAATLLVTGSERRAIIGACDDGGYYLLGMRRPHAGLFADIAWSTDTVSAQTRDRVAALGLDLVELPLWYDVDDAASLDRLAQETSGSNIAPWTRYAIEALGLPGLMRSSCVARGKGPLGLGRSGSAWC